MELFNSQLERLTDKEKERFNSVSEEISEQKREGKLLEVFRGENLENIKDRLGHPNIGSVFNNLFYFGDKARHFAIDDLAGNRTDLKNIADTSDETISSIFDRVSHVIRALIDQGEKGRVSHKFLNFFIDPENKKWFNSKFIVMKSETAKVTLRDYYLYFLHVAGKELDGVVKESFFVSTSKSKEVAEGFLDRNAAPIIFHYYIPWPFHRYAVAPWKFSHHLNPAIRHGMPTYNPEGLWDEKEVSVKGALFPHFIFGVELINDDQFIVNPHLMNTPRNRFTTKGATINQEDFHKLIKRTNLLRYGELNEYNNFIPHELR